MFEAFHTDGHVMYANIYEPNGRDMFEFALSKLKDDVGYKKWSNFLKDLGLYQRKVFNEKDEYHKKRRGNWNPEKHEDSKLHDVKVFNNYKRTKNAWLNMDGPVFSKFNLETTTDEFYENMNVNFKPWNMEFKTTALT